MNLSWWTKTKIGTNDVQEDSNSKDVEYQRDTKVNLQDKDE